MSLKIDLTGRRFGRLTVVCIGGRDSIGQLTWRCKCDCGEFKDISGRSLRGLLTRSCGCQQGGVSIEARTTRRRKLMPEYAVWLSMKQRCLDKSHKAYNRYGGRGITICERWANFDNFINDMGRRPSWGMSIERVDNNLGYCPSNCKWATALDQANNRENTRVITALGSSGSISQMARQFGKNPSTVRARIVNGWSIEDALLRPVKNIQTKTWNQPLPTP